MAAVAAVLCLSVAVSNLQTGRNDAGRRQLEDSIRRAAVTCYATEGVYPPTLKYMTAAETGHLVIATLHTKGAVNTIDRIIDSFPSTQQSQVRVQLATVLHSVVSQQLLPDKNGDLVPAMEIMHVNSAVRNMIRDCKNYQIDNVIQTSAAEGMISMDQAILNLFRAERITEDTALLYADNPEQMRRKLN